MQNTSTVRSSSLINTHTSPSNQKDAPYSDAKLTTRESMQNVASGMNKYLLWFFLLVSLLFGAMSVFLVIETGDLFLGLGGIFFGLCGFVFVVMLRSKKK